MKELQIIAIEKYLNMYFGELITSDKPTYKLYLKKDSEIYFFIYDEKHNLLYVNTKYIVDPVLKVFQTEYSKTYDVIQEWFEKKYDHKCDDIVGI